jgi:uncharacterized membrane protein
LWDAATTGSDLRYLFLLLVPLLLLWALEPVLALAAFPVLALNLLSDFWSMNRIEYQYVSAIVPCLFAAAAIGAGKLGRKWGVVAATCVLVVVGLACLSGPLASIGTYNESYRPSAAKIDAIRDAMALVPASAPVTASNRIGAHLSERRRIFIFPVRSAAEWVVVDTDDSWLAKTGEAENPVVYRSQLARLQADTAWRPVFDRDGVLVYRRVSPAPVAAADGNGGPSG